MGGVVLVSGIDTGVGKTVATGLMARQLVRQGVDAITVKVVQTGNVGFSEDLEEHRRFMEKTFPEDALKLTAPQIFAFPASPHHAAKLERRTVELDKIRHACTELAQRHDLVLAEGAGGLAVPLTEEVLTADLAAEMKWPLILVASGKLGSLNHTIMSLEFAAARKIAVRGIVYNYAPGADPVIDADSERMMKKYLAHYGFPAVVVRIPELRTPLPEPDFSALFPEVRR
ncbi:MAG: dethiobiotin synthase [Lentisphaeria bacterium]|nr:dethiobiotin synthase [Lentisphaeria bacterium]